MLWNRSSAARFWRWFEANRARIEQMGQDAQQHGRLTPEGERVMAELHGALARHDARLEPFCGRDPDGTFELIVSAGGDAGAFPAVFSLVKGAPALPGWRIVPLKPRMVVSGKIQADEVVIDTDATRYHLNGAFSPPALLVLVEGDPTDNWEQHQLLGSLLVMSLLGEHDFALRIGEIGVVSRARFEQTWGHDGRPLAELAEELPRTAVH